MPGNDRAGREALLGKARSHEEAGRLLDAIAGFRLAQRAHPDPVIARRLVRLRRAAAEGGLDHTMPPGRWPPDLPDPFPSTTGVPEIRLADLDGAVLGGGILHHGCVIVRGVVDADTAAAMRAMTIRSIEARDRSLAGMVEPDDERWHSLSAPRTEGTGIARQYTAEGGGMLAADSPLVLGALLDAYQDTGLVTAIADYLGEPPLLSVDKTVLRKVLTSEAIWHQDGKFMAGEVRAVNVWLSLSDCGPGEATPSIDIVPTRIDEILETRTRGARYSPIAIGPALLEEVAPDHPWSTPRFAPGDAIIFDDLFVHRSGSGEGYAEHRYSVESWFFGGSRIPTNYSPPLP